MPRLTKEGLDEGKQFPQMEGPFVFKHAVRRMPQVVEEALSSEGYTIEDLDMLVPHQANLRINEFVAKRLKLPIEKMYNNIHKYGNTTAATIPIGLCEVAEQNLIKEGDLVCLASFGAGFTWGAMLVQW